MAQTGRDAKRQSVGGGFILFTLAKSKQAGWRVRRRCRPAQMFPAAGTAC
jgi:hypothetical protein